MLLFVFVLWFFDILGMISWIAGFTRMPFLSGLADLSFIEDILKFVVWMGIIANLLGLIGHLILFTVWLDAKHGLLGDYCK